MQNAFDITNDGIKFHPSLRNINLEVFNRDIERLYIETVQKVFVDKSLEIGREEKNSLQRINAAYHLIKLRVQKEIRENGDRVFDHLKDTAFNSLDISDNPSITKVVASLLHDSIEDGHKTFEEIKNDFGSKVALIVLAISKKSVYSYLTPEEKIEIESSQILDSNKKIKEEIRDKKHEGTLDEEEKKAFKLIKIAKERRNTEYFSHMSSLENIMKHINDLAKENGIILNKEQTQKLAIAVFDVKFSDRINNLETQWDPKNLGKVRRKVEETKEYFLEIAKILNPKAYNKMKDEIFKLEILLNDFNGKLTGLVNRYKKD